MTRAYFRYGSLADDYASPLRTTLGSSKGRVVSRQRK
jgi:hypothetical protein